MDYIISLYLLIQQKRQKLNALEKQLSLREENSEKKFDLVLQKWEQLGFAEFTTEEPTKCPGLTQIFTKPSSITGIIWELIEREENKDGFCASNVKNLMESTVKNKI